MRVLCKLTAAGLVVEAGRHEETLLRRGRRQGPLVRRKDGNHQRRELALDLLRKEGSGGEKRADEKDEEKEISASRAVFPLPLKLHKA